MKGIRIHAKAEGTRNKFDYAFSDVVAPIKIHFKDLHWILAGVILDGRPNLDEFERTLPQYEEGQIGQYRIMKSAFLSDCCNWIKGDWSQIFGVVDIRPYAGLKDIKESKLLQDSFIAFRCVDAAFWEVFSNNAEVIDKLWSTFPDSSNAPSFIDL